VAEASVRVPGLRIWAAPALAAIATAAVVLAQADVPLFLALNHSALGRFGALWQNITVLGDGIVAAAMMLVLYRRRPDLFWAAFIAAILVSLSIQFGKALRPTLRPLGLLGPEAVRVLGDEFRNASFPSGHTATAFALAAILWPAFRSPVARVLLVLTGCLVGLSRVMTGAHWVSDALAGGALGWLLGQVSLELARRAPWGRGAVFQVILACLFAVPAVWILAGYDTSYPAGQALAFCVAVASLAAVALTFVPRSDRGRTTRDEFTT
jgi:membrane-associated phospholipid phosphatase